jgi:DNA-binding CsgD family transcriptional regulator
MRHNQIDQHAEKVEVTTPYPLHHGNLRASLITQRERQVLGMLAQGHSTATIANGLAIAVNTVESHRKKLLVKFKAKNTAELVMKASRDFWLG